MTDALLTFFFFTVGIAILATGYRAMITFLPDPVYVIPSRVAAPLLILLWGLAALSFAAWYIAGLRLTPTP